MHNRTIAIHCAVRAFLTIAVLAQSLGVAPHAAHGQTIPPELSKYAYPGEVIVEMVAAAITGQTYRIFQFTSSSTNPQTPGDIFYRPFSYSLPPTINGFVVIDGNLGVVGDTARLREVYLTELGGYLLHNTDQPKIFYFPQDELDRAKDLGSKITNAARGILAFTCWRSEKERYEVVIRAILAQPNFEKNEIARLIDTYLADIKNTQNELGITKSILSVFDDTLKASQFSNSAAIQKHSPALRSILDEINRELNIVPYQGTYSFLGESISFLNLLDFLKLAMSLKYVPQYSPERISSLVDLVAYSRQGGPTLDPDLVAAIEQVSGEAQSSSLRIKEVLWEFFRAKTVDWGKDIGLIALAEGMKKWAFEKYGFQLLGQYISAAFLVSSVFVAFSIADLLFNTSSICENVVFADYAGKTALAFQKYGRDMHGALLQSPAIYDDVAASRYRWVSIFANLTALQWYSATAAQITNARALAWLVNLVTGDEWKRIAENILEMGRKAEAETQQVLVNPTAIDEAIRKTRLASVGGGPASSSSSTVLVFDTSGSMNEPDSSGVTKLQAAQKAGGNILDIIAAENQAQSSISSQIGVVDFNGATRVVSPLARDIVGAQTALQNLFANGGTGMAGGLQSAMDLLLADTSGAKPVIILLSDGLPNVALNQNLFLAPDQIKQEVLDLASQAGQRGQCIYTVGFGIPFAVGTISLAASIDEDFLKQVAANSGCGAYYNAQSATELANIYVRLRHTSTGNLLFEQTGEIAQGETVDIGAVDVPANQSLMLFTLNWPGSRLDPILKDPNGQPVDANYQGASVSTSSSLASIIVNNPKAGQWQVAAQGVDVPEGVTTYNAAVSSRAGAMTPATSAAGSFPLVILAIVLGGGAVGVYVLSRTARRQRTGAGAVQGATARLIGLGGAMAGRTLPVGATTLTIGRGRLNTIALSDTQASRRHAVIRYGQGRWFIQDQGSSTGTFVNGQRVTATALNNGDRIRIGSTEFEFRVG